MPIPFLNPYLVHFRYIVPGVAIAAIIVLLVLQRRRSRILGFFLTLVLLAAANLAVWHYTAPNWIEKRYMNPYEFYHYYIGAKYFGELGYADMYKATVIADGETGFNHKGATIRDLDTYGFIPVTTVVRQRDAIKGLFCDARWQEFVKDIRFFRGFVSSGLWGRMLRDKGYNATPVWTMVGGFLANMTSTDSLRGVTLLALLDAFLILAAALCVWWAFDHRIALLMILMLGTHYLTSQHYTLRSAFLRLDWAMCLVMAVCMLRKERYAVAGALTAYAALARVFPLIFAFGMGARFLWDLVKTRTLNRRYLAYWTAFGLTAVVLVGGSILYDGGFDSWRQFLGKIGLHNKSISAWRIGFKYVFLMSYKGSAFWGRDLAQVFEDYKAYWWGIQAAVLLISFLCVWRLEDYEAMAYSYVPAFFLVAPTYYYHVMLVVPFLFFAGKLERPTRAAGLILMFATSMVAYKLYILYNRGYMLFFTISCMILAMVLYMMLLGLAEIFRKPEPALAPKESAATENATE